MSLVARFKSTGPTGFGCGSTAEQVTDGYSLAGRTILVTCCNSGIGKSHPPPELRYQLQLRDRFRRGDNGYVYSRPARHSRRNA